MRSCAASALPPVEFRSGASTPIPVPSPTHCARQRFPNRQALPTQQPPQVNAPSLAFSLLSSSRLAIVDIRALTAFHAAAC